MRKDHSGERYGAWTIEKREHNGKTNPHYLCRCDCGQSRVLYYGNLSSGKSKSCGCKLRESISKKLRKHGCSRGSMDPHWKASGRTKEYSVWSSMKTRCTNKNNRSFKNYGGRGIQVCKEWMDSFECFLKDMGVAPEGATIERVDNNGNYTKENCEWADAKAQTRNRRSTRLTQQIVDDLRAGKISAAETVRKTGCAKSTASSAKNGISWK